MKKITEEQIKAILDELFKLNIPSQSYFGIQNLFLNLPNIEHELNQEQIQQPVNQ